MVEKFIGDAVMAVRGATVAAEGDAERAVRAALDVVDAAAALGGQVGAPGLAARAGVVTGEVAVTVGAVGQGVVAGEAFTPLRGRCWNSSPTPAPATTPRTAALSPWRRR